MPDVVQYLDPECTVSHEICIVIYAYVGHCHGIYFLLLVDRMLMRKLNHSLLLIQKTPSFASLLSLC